MKNLSFQNCKSQIGTKNFNCDKTPGATELKKSSITQTSNSDKTQQLKL